MTGRVLRYSRPNAELRAMISRLLSAEQLRALAASADLDGLFRLLLDSPYGPRLGGLLEGAAAVAAVERAVMGSMVHAYQRTALLLGDRAGALVEQMARGLEVDNLKAILRARERGETLEVLRSLLVPLGRLSHLPGEELLRAPDVESVSRELEGTEYGKALRLALPRYLAEQSLFPVEISLDLSYYRRLWSAVQELAGRDRQTAGRMMGIRYDLLNVEWIIRYRLVYRLSPEEVFNYTLPYGLRISDAVVRRAATADGAERIAAELPEPYRSLLSGPAGARDFPQRAGLAIHRYLVEVARSALVGYPFHIGVAVAYLWLKEAEVHDLRLALEGRRYGRAAEAIQAEMWGLR